MAPPGPRPPRGGHYRSRPPNFRGGYQAKTWTKASAKTAIQQPGGSTSSPPPPQPPNAMPKEKTMVEPKKSTNPARSLAMQESLLERGLAQMEAGAIESACDLLGAALRLEFRADIAAKQAKCELELKRYEAAIQLCDKALKVEPKLSLGLEIKEKALKQIIKQREGWKNRKMNGNELFAAGDFQKALEAYDAALEVCDEAHRPVLFTNRASCFLRLGKTDASIEASNQALALNPKWARAYERKAQALHYADKDDEALLVVEEGLKQLPANTDLLGLQRQFGGQKDSPQPDQSPPLPAPEKNSPLQEPDQKKQQQSHQSPVHPGQSKQEAHQQQQQQQHYTQVQSTLSGQQPQSQQQLGPPVPPRTMLQQPAMHHQMTNPQATVLQHHQQHLQVPQQRPHIMPPPMTLQPIMPPSHRPMPPGNVAPVLMPLPTAMMPFAPMQYPTANYARAYYPHIQASQQQQPYRKNSGDRHHQRLRRPQQNDRYDEHRDHRQRRNESDYHERRHQRRSSPSSDSIDRRRNRRRSPSRSSSSSHSDTRRRTRTRSPLVSHRRPDSSDEESPRRRRASSDEAQVIENEPDEDDHDVFQSSVAIKRDSFDDEASEDDSEERHRRHNPRRRYAGD